MAIYSNNKAIRAIYKGVTPFVKVYKGLELIWNLANTVIKGFSGYPVTATGTIGDHLRDYNIHGNTLQFRIPQDYMELEFVAATGTQYINTGIHAARFVHDIAFMNGDRNLMGNSVKSANYWGSALSGNSYEMGRTYAAANTSVRRTVEYNNLNSDRITLEANGTTLTSWSTPTTETYSIFKISDGDFYSSAVMYSFQAFDANGNFLANYIPARRVADQEVGFYDTVSGEFKTNQGTGSFTGGPKADPTINNPIHLYSVGDEYYDNSEITAVGEVAVSTDGIASNFSNSNYVRTTIFDATRPFVLTFGDLMFAGINGDNTFGALVNVQNTKSLEFLLDYYNRQVIVTDGYEVLAVELPTLDENDDFTVQLEHTEAGEFVLKAFDGSTLLAEAKQATGEFGNYGLTTTSYVRIGSNARYAAYPNTLDLMEFSLTSNGDYITKPRKYLIPIEHDYNNDYIVVNLLVTEPLRKVGTVVDTLDFKNQVIIRRTKEILEYNNEEVLTPFLSTTGALTLGAHVIYVAPEVTQENVFLPTLQTEDGNTTYKVNTFIPPSLLYIEAEVRADSQ